jgi:hypothetical protein
LGNLTRCFCAGAWPACSVRQKWAPRSVYNLAEAAVLAHD